jgi:ketosteroid isomerase-like protein
MKTSFKTKHSKFSIVGQLLLAGCSAALSLALVGQARAADTQSANETKLRESEVAMSAAAVGKDLDKVVSYYADDAVVFAPNSPAATTNEAIRNAWKDVLMPTGASTSWKAMRVEVAKSGDLAYTSGTYDGTMVGADGRPVKDSGNYLTVWKKQADGTWKILVDTWATDLPAPAAKP